MLSSCHTTEPNLIPLLPYIVSRSSCWSRQLLVQEERSSLVVWAQSLSSLPFSVLRSPVRSNLCHLFPWCCQMQERHFPWDLENLPERA